MKAFADSIGEQKDTHKPRSISVCVKVPNMKTLGGSEAHYNGDVAITRVVQNTKDVYDIASALRELGSTLAGLADTRGVSGNAVVVVLWSQPVES